MTDSTCLTPGEMGRTPPTEGWANFSLWQGKYYHKCSFGDNRQYHLAKAEEYPGAHRSMLCTHCGFREIIYSHCGHTESNNKEVAPAAESVNIDTDGGEEPPIIDCAGAYITRDGTHAEVEFGGDGHWHGTVHGKNGCWNPDGSLHGTGFALQEIVGKLVSVNIDTNMSQPPRGIDWGGDVPLLTAAQILEIERRVKEYDKDPSKAIPWDVVKNKILHKLYGGGVVNEPPVKKVVPPFKMGDHVEVTGGHQGTITCIAKPFESLDSASKTYLVGFTSGYEAWYTADKMKHFFGIPTATPGFERAFVEDEGGDDVVEQGELDGTSRLVIDLPEDLVNALDNIAGEAGLSSNTVVVGILINYILNRRRD